MAVFEYDKDGELRFRVYVNIRGKNDPSLRIQRSKFGFDCPKKAAREEKKLFKAVIEEIAQIEGRGLRWGDVVFRWKTAAELGHLGDKYANCFLVRDHVNRIKRYTEDWNGRIASDLTKGDGRALFLQAKEMGASNGLLKKIKSSINVVYNWGIEEKLIVGRNSTPVDGLDLREKKEKVPPILSLDEVRLLLERAKIDEHPWYHIWAFAFLTGMRSGELLALRWSDVDLDKRIITVSRSYNKRLKSEKSTKAGYWRSIPISPDLQEVLTELKGNGDGLNLDHHVLPRAYEWVNGGAGKVLRDFLSRIGINKTVVFHTLRACFATHCLASGIEPAKIMRIGGWSDFKTFQIYVRLAGIEVRGATDGLQVIPRIRDDAKVINFSNLRKR